MQVDTLVEQYLNGGGAPMLAQISQFIQLISNLMLLNNVLTQDLANSVCEMLLRTIRSLFQPISSGFADRDVALLGCIMCLGKIISLGTVSIAQNTLVELVSLLLAITQDHQYQISTDTKVGCLRVLKNVVDAVPGVGQINVCGAMLIVGLDGLNILYNLSLRPIRSNDSKTNFTEELNTLIDAIMRKIVQNIEIVYCLPQEGVSTVTAMMYSSNAQAIGDINWSGILDAVWSSRLGIDYMFDILSNILTVVDSNRHQYMTKQFCQRILQLLDAAITHGSLVSLSQVSQIGTLISALELTIPPLDLLALSCLVNSIEGINALLKSEKNTIIESLIGALTFSAEYASAASQLMTTMISSGCDNAVEILLNNGLVDSILNGLRKFGTADETFAQNAVYMLRVLCDIVGIANVRLPKETMNVLQDIINAFSHNAYCVETSQYVYAMLSEAYAIGPEAQLEQILRDIVYHSPSAAGWNTVATDPSQVYYYNHVTGVTQWEQHASHKKVTDLLVEMCEVLAKLNYKLDDVTIPVATSAAMYTLFNSHGMDIDICKMTMRFVHCQV
jgi:hypothetical protein